MSYIRMFSPYKYLYGFSKDYVFTTEYRKKEMIEDYGSISNKTIIELLLRFGDYQEDLISTQMGIRLAENLGIKLRKKPLTIDQEIDESYKIMKKVSKEFGLQDNGERNGK